ncbi:response regulator [Candidatus Nitrosotenuis cloacae]|uniref:response regulator n=1 Tax=Candidatus Nitrosotenuis cloacae TaxID=1603555 RepID=UPI002280DB1F|nr:response regulator [Candidatus Nitrosotenuis cloacae]
MKILHIDDNSDITKMFSKYFKLKGIDVSIANDGQNGLQMITNERFDVVLLDLAMPNFSGRDIVDHLHRNGIRNQCKIIALTASSISVDDELSLRGKGVHSVLRKPIDPDELLNYLQAVK